MDQQQLSWFKHALEGSTGKWKVICSGLPIGLVVGDGKDFEAFSNGAPGVGTREQQLAGLFSFMKAKGLRNVIWLSADVHHASSMHYHPDRAVFKDFDPFWEFVSGPIHAGSFGPSRLDKSFGPERLFNSRDGVPYSRSPNDQNQFFGLVDIAPDGHLTLSHMNRGGELRWKHTLEPA
jgi:alkaline phosphatase D